MQGSWPPPLPKMFSSWLPPETPAYTPQKQAHTQVLEKDYG